MAPRDRMIQGVREYWIESMLEQVVDDRDMDIHHALKADAVLRTVNSIDYLLMLQLARLLQQAEANDNAPLGRINLFASGAFCYLGAWERTHPAS